MNYHAAEKTDLEMSLAVSEEKLADNECRIQVFEHTKDTLYDMATKVKEPEDKSKSSEKQVPCLKDKLSEQSNQLIDEDATSSVYRERVVVLGMDWRALAEVERLTT